MRLVPAALPILPRGIVAGNVIALVVPLRSVKVPVKVPMLVMAGQETVPTLAEMNALADLGFEGNEGLGQGAEINGNRVTVGAVTQNIRSFTTLPYIFTTLSRAQTYLDAAPEQASYTLVKVAPGYSIDDVRKRDVLRIHSDNDLGF